MQESAQILNSDPVHSFVQKLAWSCLQILSYSCLKMAAQMLEVGLWWVVRWAVLKAVQRQESAQRLDLHDLWADLN